MDRTRPALLAALAALSASTGCGNMNSPSGAGPLINAVVSPSPVVAQPSADTAFTWSAQFTLTLTDSGGVGSTVTALTATGYEVVGGIVTATLGTGSARIDLDAPSTRIQANGSLVLGYTVYYTLPGGGRTALVRIAVGYTDDAGQAHSGTVDVNLT